MRWSAEREISEGESLADAVSAVLQHVPRDRWTRCNVVAAVGAAWSQVKMVEGLPPVADPRDLPRMVRQCAGRLFLTNGRPLETAAFRREPGGVVWAAAVDRPVIEELSAGCVEARCRLQAVLPTAVVLSAAIRDERIVWRDGDVKLELSYCGNRLSAMRRLTMRDDSAAPPPSRVEPGLNTLGEDAPRFADAFGAAESALSQPLAIKPGRSLSARVVPRWRMAAAFSAVLLAAVAALAAPGLVAELQAKRAATELAAMAGTRREVVAALAELRQVTAALVEIDSFAAARCSHLEFLRRLTEALPPNTAIVALRLTSGEGTVVLLAEVAAGDLGWMEQVTDVHNPVIVGPLTRELVGAKTLERVTVHFDMTQCDSQGDGGEA